MSIAMPNLALNQVQAGSLTVAKAWGSWTGTNRSGVLLNQFGAEPNTARAVNIYLTDWQGHQLLYPTARTNLYGYSTLLTNGVWYGPNLAITGPSASPDGSSATWTLTENTANSSHALLPQGANVFTLSPNQAVYLRMLVGPGNGTRNLGVLFNAYNGTSNFGGGLYVNPTNGATGLYGAYGAAGVFDEISAVPTSGGYLLTARFTPAAGFYVNASYFHMLDGTSDTYTGDGVSNVTLFGPMCSVTPGAYIPNSGVATPLTDYTLAGTTVNLAQDPESTAVTTATFYGT
ncbi:MAG: phage head spike fiber domain-containing protein [Acidobacteriaceae bacterium]